MIEQTTEYLKNFSEWRSERAKAILEKGNPESIDKFTYLVPSQFDSSKKYQILIVIPVNARTLSEDVQEKINESH